MDHRIYKEIPQVGGSRELGKLQTSFNLNTFYECYLELVSKELNQLAAILHIYAGGLIFMK